MFDNPTTLLPSTGANLFDDNTKTDQNATEAKGRIRKSHIPTISHAIQMMISIPFIGEHHFSIGERGVIAIVLIVHSGCSH